jgi:mono/diheme cytochrome c family protein
MKSLVVPALVLTLAAGAWAQSSDLVARGEAAFRGNGCYGCHLVGTFGTPIGPDLSTVGRRYAPEYLARWLRDPALQRPNAHMPALELTEADVAALAAYLSTLR